jgi:hypothetical protein
VHQRNEHVPKTSLLQFESPQHENIDKWLWIHSSQTPHQASVVHVTSWEVITKEDTNNIQKESIIYVHTFETMDYFLKM